jgi:dihydrofolate synthase/folylpolyglutamate synthase
MTYEQAVAYIESLNLYGWRLGNARMEALLERLGNPHLRIPVVHITGTNGKGSTTALVASILKHAGYRVGAYFSPYVFDFRERILIDGEPIPEELLVEGVARCKPLIERLTDTEYGQVTEFELKTALAFWAYAQAGVEIAVMEVGLGGRLDATNVITPLVSVLVSVGLDHTDRLGPTHADIAYEKSKIFKPGRPAVSGALHPDARAMARQVAQAQGVPLLEVLPEGTSSDLPTLYYTPLPSPRDSSVRLRFDSWELDAHPQLIGDHQRHNVACAVGAALHLRQQGYTIPDSAIQAGVQHAHLPGRMQVVGDSPKVVLDGAHNSDAARALAFSLPRVFKYQRMIMVFGMLRPHEPSEVLRHLLPLAEIAIFTRAPSERAYPPQHLLECAQRWLHETQGKLPVRMEVAETPSLAFQRALELATPDDLVLVTGSFYLVGAYPLEG